MDKRFVEESLNSLESLNAMIKIRQHYCYVEKRIIEPFYIFGGAFFLDTSGNCMKADKFFPTFENVLTVEEFRKRLKLIGHTEPISYSFHKSIPTAGTCCPICEQKWNIENFLEATYEHDDQFYHKKCLTIKKEQTGFEKFQKIFKQAGFKTFFMKPIKNQYCPRECCSSWYEVETPLCNFVIGDRKRVINIEWTKFNALKIFENENVTKSEFNIHAWSNEKAIEYLTKINNLINNKIEI